MTCTAGLSLCGASCVDLSASRNDCGRCGNVCPPEQSCSAGQCVCGTGLADCSGACHDLANDPLNCGACGLVCDANTSCVNGTCVGQVVNTGGTGGIGGIGGIGGTVADTGGIPGTGGITNSGGTGGTDVPTLGTVVFDPPGGPFSGAISVTLSTDQAGTEIRYTTDGTAPTAASTLFDGTALAISQTTQVRAGVFLDGVLIGAAGAVYVASAVDVTVDLPILVLDVYGAGEPDREFVDAALLVYDTPGATLSSPPTLATRAAIHLRGNSTTFFDKKPYRLELRDANDQDLDHPLLGMPAESDWVLRNPFADKALIRDAISYGLARDLGMQAPRFALCEVYRNVDAEPVSADDYMGVYLLTETIKNQKDRLNLQQLKPDDLALPEVSGGYIFRFEWQAAEEPIVECETADHCWKFLEVADPVPLAVEQEAWLAQHLTGFVNALFGGSFDDPTSGYAPYIDLASFVDHVIINELGREMDAYVRSQYFFKDRDTKDAKIYAGPIWDRDLTFDVGGFFGNREIEGFQYQSQFGVTWEGEGGTGSGGTSGTGGFTTGGLTNTGGRVFGSGGGGWVRPPIAMTRTDGNDWFLRLMEDPGFQAAVAARWQTLRAGLLSDAEFDARVDGLAAPLAAAAARNFAKWDILTTEMVAGTFQTTTQDTWEGQVAHLKDWAHQRAAWLDTQWK